EYAPRITAERAAVEALRHAGGSAEIPAVALLLSLDRVVATGDEPTAGVVERGAVGRAGERAEVEALRLAALARELLAVADLVAVEHAVAARVGRARRRGAGRARRGVDRHGRGRVGMR